MVEEAKCLIQKNETSEDEDSSGIKRTTAPFGLATIDTLSAEWEGYASRRGGVGAYLSVPFWRGIFEPMDNGFRESKRCLCRPGHLFLNTSCP